MVNDEISLCGGRLSLPLLRSDSDIVPGPAASCLTSLLSSRIRRRDLSVWPAFRLHAPVIPLCSSRRSLSTFADTHATSVKNTDREFAGARKLIPRPPNSIWHSVLLYLLCCLSSLLLHQLKISLLSLYLGFFFICVVSHALTFHMKGN